MNTFETLQKYKASLEIEEYSKPNKDNYTKAINIVYFSAIIFFIMIMIF